VHDEVRVSGAFPDEDAAFVREQRGRRQGNSFVTLAAPALFARFFRAVEEIAVEVGAVEEKDLVRLRGVARRSETVG
jgi:hypothetical protein